MALAALGAVVLACSGRDTGEPEATARSAFEGRETRYSVPDWIELTLRADYEVVAEGIEFATSLTAGPDGRLFVTEFRSGDILQVLPPEEPAGEAELAPFAHVPLPEAMTEEQGLWNIAVHPTEPYLYASAIAETYPDEELRGTWRVVRFEILEDGNAGPLEEVCSDFPAAIWHNGGAIVFDEEGSMFLSIGDVLEVAYVSILRSRMTNLPDSAVRELTRLAGAIIRIDPANCNAAMDEAALKDIVYAYGFRNAYGLAFASDGTLFASENGPGCCDQVLRVEEGSDNGWARYGVFAEDLDEMQADESVNAPLVWSGDHTIAPTEIVYYDGDLYPELSNSLIYGTFHAGALLRIGLSEDGRSAVYEEALVILPVEEREEYGDPGGINGVTVGPDGTLYFSTLDTIYRITDVRPLE